MHLRCVLVGVFVGETSGIVWLRSGIDSFHECENRSFALMIHCFAAGSDRVVRVDHQTLGKSVLAVKVGALQMKKIARSHLVADTMRNVGGEKTPFIAAAKRLCREKEQTDLLVRPIAGPLLDIYVAGRNRTYSAPRDDKSMCWDWTEDTSDSSPWLRSTFHNPLLPTVPEERRFGFADGASSVSTMDSSAVWGSPSKGIPYRLATTGSTELILREQVKTSYP